MSDLSPNKSDGALRGARVLPWPVWLIFGLCLGPELWLSGTDLGLWGQATDRRWAFEYLGFWAGLVDGWLPNYALQPWLMFVTYGFLHAGLMHFGLNMLTLFSLGPPVVRVTGPWRFLLSYAALLVAGAAGFALFPILQAPMVGASGALFGLAGMILCWDYQRQSSRHRSIVPVLKTIAMIAVLNLALWAAMDGQLAWQTHLGGFVGGWLLALMIRA